MEFGDIYRREHFYADPQTGELLAKYLLFLAPTRSGDWVIRLLTSREHGRRRDPPCYHGDPYPGFYLGPIDGSLVKDTWVDLRHSLDADADDARALIGKGITRQQEQSIRDQLARGA